MWLSPAEQKLSSVSPSLQNSAKEHIAAAEARTCCRYQKLLTAPKAAICRRPVLASALSAHRCWGWKVFKHSHELKQCRSNRALQVETHPRGPCRCLGVQPESISATILLKNNMNMQIMQDKVKWDLITPQLAGTLRATFPMPWGFHGSVSCSCRCNLGGLIPRDIFATHQKTNRLSDKITYYQLT